MEDIKVSVIVPIFGVRDYIAKCLESIFNQTLKNFEIILVDDASTDGSLEIAQHCIDSLKRKDISVKIIRHAQNKGLPSTRNSGLSKVSGKYVFHFDSDDYADAEMLETLVDEAELKQADIVWCDWYLTTSNGDRYMRQPSLSSADEAVKAMLGGAMKFNVWNKLIRKKLYDTSGIKFPDGQAMGEDMTIIKLFSKATVVSYVPKAFYHYVKTNPNAYSQTYNESHLRQLRANVADLENYLGHHATSSYAKEINFFKLEVKFPFLLMKDNRKFFFRLWKSWYPEADLFIGNNPYISSRSNMVQKLANKNLFPLVTLYANLLNIASWLVSRKK